LEFMPCLVRSMADGGIPVIRLGHPLLDDYLGFVAARARANTWLAVAYDLRVFFAVVAKPPAEVTAADEHEPGQHVILERVQLIRSCHGTRIPQVPHYRQRQPQAPRLHRYRVINSGNDRPSGKLKSPQPENSCPPPQRRRWYWAYAGCWGRRELRGYFYARARRIGPGDEGASGSLVADCGEQAARFLGYSPGQPGSPVASAAWKWPAGKGTRGPASSCLVGRRGGWFTDRGGAMTAHTARGEDSVSGGKRLGAGAGIGPGPRRVGRRRRVLLGIVAVALAASAGGLWASAYIKSPAEVAARAKPPGLTLMTASVRQEVIKVTVLAQGVVTKPRQISGPASTAGGGGPGNAQPIVTRIFARSGSTVRPGSVILEVAGQPLFVFAGAIPAYRDLVPGESGADVAQLQAGLTRLGFSVGADTRGYFGPGTASAVAYYYHHIRYPVPDGSVVPLSQVMFVPRLPAQVVKLDQPVGGAASGPLVALSMGKPGIAGQLNPADARLVRPGMRVQILNPATGSTLVGRVRSVGTRMQNSGSISGAFYVAMRISTRTRVPVSMAGQDVKLTIIAAHTARPVLTVPQAAIFASADGQTYVTKVTATRSRVRVPVRTGFTGDGLVEVTPVDGGTLTGGDTVAVGVGYVRTTASGGGASGVAGGPVPSR
jgi:peptidoglycan hydrolase-like protein with peptidoglycan-binding domain